MLLELYIKDMALIDEARIEFGTGLNVLTGETGAGKTVVVGAVNLLLGDRADSSLIRRGRDKAEVEGMFSIPATIRGQGSKLEEFIGNEDELIVRRVISTDGKNKCYINDRMVTVGTLSEIARELIDLHGQHEHQSLFRVSSHVEFLDKYGGDELIKQRERYQELLRELKEQKEELEKLRGSERDLLAKRDLLMFQVSEIERAGLAVGEDLDLVRERDILRNAEKLYLAVAKAVNSLSGSSDFVPATELVAKAFDDLRSIANIDPDLDGLAERLNVVLIEIEDCATMLRGYETKLDFPPGRLQEVEDRLAVISLLKKKYGSTISDIISYKESAAEELLVCDMSGERIELLEQSIARIEEELSSVALTQSDMRKVAAERFSREVIEELADLNMSGADFKVSFTREPESEGLLVAGERVRVYSHGIDKIEFMVSANRGEPAKPLVKIASGGEISRIMLALKIILADADAIPTLIFDEIDVGIGGTTATAVGNKMSLLGEKHQVITVTHLPQIASFADCHFSVSKGEAGGRIITQIEALLDTERVSEMARLLSGNMHSEVSLRHAQELIVEAQSSKSKIADGRLN